MQESPFGFNYTWADLKPVRPLAIIVLVAQIGGAILSAIFPSHSTLFRSLWFGAAIVTFPAFLAGLAVQSRWRPGSLGENRVMVWRFGSVALLLSLGAIVMPLVGFE